MSAKNQAGKASVRSKQETTELVKDMNMKRKNWLREREDSLKRKDGERSRSTSAHQTPSSSPQTVGRVPSSPRPGARAKTKPNPQSKFGLSYVVKPVGGSSKESGYDSENSSTHQHEDYKYNNGAGAGRHPKGSSKPPIAGHYSSSSSASKTKGFTEWMKHRQESLEKQSRDGASNSSVSTPRTSEQDQSQQRGLSGLGLGGGGGGEHRAGSVLDRVELDTGDMSDYTVASSASKSHRSVLEPEEFDDLADKIIRRVKSELNLHTKSGGSKQKTINSVDVDTCSNGGSKHGDAADAPERKSRGLDSHYCGHCGKLMMPPRHDVMMVVPCGHNMCKKCCNERKHCASCSCMIGSFTNNIMLQKVITDYSNSISGASGGGGGGGARSARTRRRQESMSSGHTYTPHTYTDRSNYKEDLASVQIRIEALETEEAGLSTRLQQLQKHLQEEKTQVSSLSSEERRVKEEISSLQKRLGEIDKRRTDAETRHRKIEKTYSEDLQRLASLKQSLKSLTGEKEKLMVLVGDEN